MNYIIESKSLRFAFSKAGPVVLEDINLQIPKGVIYGFIGINGSGKTTIMRILTGLLQSDENNVFLFGKSLNKQIPDIFHRIGTLIEYPSLYEHLTGFENLKYIAMLKQIPKKFQEKKILETLELVGLSTAKHRKVKTYSLGMKQRLGIAQSLMGEPDILFLDEPINGLDPQGITIIRELLLNLNKRKNVTIFVSSHLLEELQKIMTHIGILHKGRLEFQGKIEDFYKEHKDIKTIEAYILNLTKK